MAFTPYFFLYGVLVTSSFIEQISCGFILDDADKVVCGAVLNAGPERGSHFDSPGFPDYYPENAYCFWEITAPTGDRINLTSDYFDVEYQKECLFDYLSIEDGVYGEYGNTRFCGHDRLDYISESNVIKIHFNTDDDGSSSGFRILYTAVLSHPLETLLSCNKTLSQEGLITSPGYPQRYPADTECFYLIQAPKNHHVRLTFNDFELEPRPCLFDTLVVYDGTDFESENVLDKYCGSVIPMPIVSRTNSLAVKFTSDNNLEFLGFRFTVEFISGQEISGLHDSNLTAALPNANKQQSRSTTEDTPTADEIEDATRMPSADKNFLKQCNTTVSLSSGKITSPGFPREYPHDTVCVTKLRSDVISAITVRFINFTIEESENCSYDSVRIYPVSLSTRALVSKHQPFRSAGTASLERVEPPLRVMCGSLLHLEAVLTWEGLGVDVVFRSDSSVSGTGFVAEVLIVPVDDGPSCADVCKNGGSCLETLLPDGAIDWICSCADGYTGDMCQSNLLTCKETLCRNGGFCTDNGGEPSCVCPAEFKGKFCEEAIDPADAGNLYFTKLTGNMSVSIGSGAIFECAVSDPSAHVMWLFHDRILGNAEWSRGVEVHPQGVLIIPEVRDEHSGRYTCMATTLLDYAEKSSWLSLTEPCSLHVAKAPRNITVREGQTAMFECYVPDAEVLLWRKDGDLIESGARKRILVNKYLLVKKVLETDEGLYTCAARASTGCFSKVSAYLTVEASGHSLECGLAQTQAGERRSGRISMGHQAAPGSAPWHVILRENKKDTTFCGGSLISADTVLTAAHCVKHFEYIFGYPFDPMFIQMYIGTNYCDGKNGTLRELKSYIMHENFNDTHYNNDIAIFKMDRPVPFSKDVMPVCLEKAEFVQELLKPRRIGIVTGCGAQYNQGPSTIFLNEIQLPYVARAICEERAAKVNTTFTSGMFCAGYPRSMRGDACQGDSGGPYIMQFHGRAIQVGIVSWGVGCDRDNHYGYYTDLAQYYFWIMDKISNS
ncbi:hypothetical protein RRG08_013679 [Elysia crispata]|uniref:Vitamin K-dependent protein C n=1 Tax=Elysia crispata TaxID=231223 RepID=A0AAE1A1M1_9GAST|nr:hypothetical protein RRG08_013679 [Elysia crispata]